MSSLRDRIDAQRKAIADQKSAFERPYRWKQGKTLVRVLPGLVEADDFSKPYGAHYIKNPSDGKIIAVVGDAEICYGKVCPVRQAIAELIQQRMEIGDEAGAKLIKEWLARDSYVTNVEILGGADTENKGKVVRVEFTRNQYDSILSLIDTILMTNPNFNMNEGLPVMVERVGSGVQDTKYTFSAVPGTVPPPTPAVLDQRSDLQSYVDGKFGISVTKALTALSSMLGKDVTQTAIGSAMQATAIAAQPAQAAQTGVAALADDDIPDFTTPATPEPVDAAFEDLAALTEAAAEPTPQPAQAAPTQAAPAGGVADEFADILAELEGL